MKSLNIILRIIYYFNIIPDLFAMQQYIFICMLTLCFTFCRFLGPARMKQNLKTFHRTVAKLYNYAT